MHWLAYLAIFVLYLAVLRVKRPEAEPHLWLKVVGLYLLAIVTFKFASFALPLGLLVGLWAVNRKATRNRGLKRLLLFFGLIYFVSSLFLPPYSVGELVSEHETQMYINQFTDVESVTSLSPDASQQEELREFLRRSESGEAYDLNYEYIYLFRAWLLKEHGIPLQSAEQIYDKWPYPETNERYIKKDHNTEVAYADFQGKHYFALFKRSQENTPFRLVLVIQYGDSPNLSDSGFSHANTGTL